MGLRTLAVAALVSVLPLAGCLAGVVEHEGTVAAYVDIAHADPGGLASYALFVRNDAAVTRSYEVTFPRAPEGWHLEAEATFFDLAAGESRALFLTAQPPIDAPHGVSTFSVALGGVHVPLHLVVEKAPGETARRGVGLQVLTVGVWTNGTIFYTNWKAVTDAGAAPSVDLSPEEPDAYDPLKVYVGGERGKRPSEPYNRSGYVNVIPGFDAALPGLKAGHVRAVRIAPEDAYTRPGSEKHRLYGDALAFLIRAVSVDVLPPDPTLPLPIRPPVGTASSWP